MGRGGGKNSHYSMVSTQNEILARYDNIEMIEHEFINRFYIFLTSLT